MYFETIKCYDEEVLNIHWHQRRIANTVGLNINLLEYIYPPSNQLLKCKVTYDKDGILDISYATYNERKINSFKVVIDNDIEYEYKSRNRDKIDYLFSKKENADEIIIIKNNLITDTSIANIALYISNHWYTPKSPLLNGTCKDRLIEEKFLIEKDLTIDDLLSTKKIALMNAMIDFKIINNFDIIP